MLSDKIDLIRRRGASDSLQIKTLSDFFDGKGNYKFKFDKKYEFHFVIFIRSFANAIIINLRIPPRIFYGKNSCRKARDLSRSGMFCF